MICGWLSPEGVFYPCGPYEHVDLAEKLVREHFPPTQEKHCNDDILLKHRWMKLFYDGIVIGDFFKPEWAIKKPFITDEQILFINSVQCQLSAKQERYFSMYLDAESCL